MDVISCIPPLRLERSRQAAPQVFESLRGLIVDLALPPGTVLPRAELAERYGVSQTPVRDALMKLGEEGLVDIFPSMRQLSAESTLRPHCRRTSCAGPWSWKLCVNWPAALLLPWRHCWVACATP